MRHTQHTCSKTGVMLCILICTVLSNTSAPAQTGDVISSPEMHSGFGMGLRVDSKDGNFNVFISAPEIGQKLQKATDLDQDGSITLVEAKQAAADFFPKCDTNSDATI